MKKLSTNSTLLKAKSYVSKGELDQARRLYQSVLESFPKNLRAKQGLLALKHIKEEDSNSIEKEISELLTLYKKGQLMSVVKQAQKLSSKFPNSIMLLKILGVTFRDLGRLQESEISFKKLIDLDPSDHNSHNNLGIVLKARGNLSEAIESFKNAIQMNSTYTGAFNNLGCTYQDQGKLYEAIKSFRKAISLSPNYAEGFYNLGNALQDLGNSTEAISAYNKATELKPNYIGAYYNIGVALQSERKLGESLKAYEKVIDLQPNNISAHINLGVILYDQGKIEQSIICYKRVLELDPSFTNSFSNIFFPLRCIKWKDLKSYHRWIKDLSKLSSREVKNNLPLLTYKLDRGSHNIEKSFNRNLDQISKDKTLVIHNPNILQKQTIKIEIPPKKIVALMQTGRAGTGLLHSLIDGHSKVSVLPSIYFSEYFDSSTWAKISAGGWNEMIDRFIDTYPILFDASNAKPVLSINGTLLKDLGKEEGLCNVGDEKNEILKVDKKRFSTELNRLISCQESVDALSFFKLIHIAYEKVVYDCSDKSVLFYHIHNPDIYSQLNFMRLAPNANWIMMVREPIQSCESWIKKEFQKGDYNSVTEKITTLLHEIDNIIFRKHASIGLRLEDLKLHPKETLATLCEWMEIKEEASLYEMTAQGKKWWGDPSSPDFGKEGMNPFGLSSINRQVGTIFTEHDQYVLKTLFYPFRVAFAYTKRNEAKFLTDLAKVRPLLDQMFDFEKKIMEIKGMTPHEFMQSGPFKFLRSGLIDRWNTLNELGTYPHMIKPLMNTKV